MVSIQVFSSSTGAGAVSVWAGGAALALVLFHPPESELLFTDHDRNEKESSHYQLHSKNICGTYINTYSLLQAPYLPANSGVLQDANLLFHGFLSWPEPCSSAAKRLLNVIQQELRAPGWNETNMHSSEIWKTQQ